MAEKQVGVRLSVIDGGKARAELRAFGDDGAAALAKINQATRPAGAGLRVVDGVAGDLRDRMETAGGGIGVAGVALRAIGAAGALAAGAIGLVSLAFARGLSDFEEAERISIRLESVLKATGYAAGLTADELDDYADSLEKTTLASAEQVKEAAGILATFRSVSGDTFTRTLSLAQDLSAVFGQSLSSSATQLGKALEDPEQGLTALSRVGVTFSATQKDMIQQMVRVGDQAGAQKAILDVLEKQVGGAGAGEASGLTGAFKRARDATGNLFEEFVRATGAGRGLGVILDELITKNFDYATSLLKGKDISQQIDATNKQLIEAQNQLKTLQDLANSPIGQPFDKRAAEDAQKTVDRLEAEVSGLIEKARSRVTEKETAEAGRQKAEADARTERAMARLKEMQKDIAELGTPAEKIDAVRKALADTVKELDKLRNQDGTNASVVDDAVRAAQDLAERRITAIRKGDTEANKARNDITREAKKVFEDTRTAAEAYAVEMERLNKLLKAGAIDQGTFDRAAKKAQETLEASSKGAMAGFSSAVKTYLESASDLASQVETATLGAFGGIEDALVSLATTGKASMSDLANSIIADFMRIAIRQQILAPLVSSLQGSTGGLLGSALSLFGIGGGTVGATTGATFVAGQHTGGVAGEGSFVMRDDPGLYRYAPRHHSGIDPYGLLPGERRAILKEGEGVFTQGQMKALGAGLGGGSVQVTTPQTKVIFRGAPAGTRAEERSDGSGGREVEIYFDQQVSGLLTTSGSETSRALKGGYGASQRVSER